MDTPKRNPLFSSYGRGIRMMVSNPYILIRINPRSYTLHSDSSVQKYRNGGLIRIIYIVWWIAFTLYIIRISPLGSLSLELKCSTTTISCRSGSGWALSDCLGVYDQLWNGFGLQHHRMCILHFARFVTRPIHHHPSDDSIPYDRKWGYEMKLRVTAAFPEGLYFYFFIFFLLILQTLI